MNMNAASARAAVLAITPVVLLAAMLSHPYLPGRLPDHAGVAAAVADGTTRWGLTHIAAGVASGVVVLAFIAIRGYLRERGDQSLSAVGLGFVVMGSLFYALLPGMEFTPLAAIESGGDPEAAQAALDDWFVPVLFIGAVLFAIGVGCVAGAIRRLGGLSPSLTMVVVLSLIVWVASRFAPFAVAQLYIQSAAALIALWPLAWVMRAKQQAPLPA